MVGRRGEIQGRSLAETVQDFIQRYHLLPPGETVLVGVSGGADSVCLLHVLVSLQNVLGISLHIVHLDHGLRGAESDADADYVRRLAQRLDVPATVERRDVRGYREKHRMSLEEAAREVRYNFFAEVAESIGANRVAVGHTADDQIETILMNLVRGTGLTGLRGMQSLSTRRSPTGKTLLVVRPLLGITRAESVAYCTAHGLEPRFDVSNLSYEYRRNRFRLEVIPTLEKYNPRLRQAILRLVDIINDQVSFMEGQVERLWEFVAAVGERKVDLDLRAVRRLPAALQRELLRKAIERLVGDLKGIEAVHIEKIVSAMEKPAGKRIILPRGLTFSISYERATLALHPIEEHPFPSIVKEYRLQIPGVTELPGWKVRAEVLTPGLKYEEVTGWRACLDYDKVGGNLVVRGRRPGDYFYPLGMEQPKKLQDFMVDARIPRHWRGRIPLVVSGEDIVWIAGWRIDDRFKVTTETRRVLCLEFERVKGLAWSVTGRSHSSNMR